MDNLKPTRSLSQFKFWCQKVLPLVYDESLSYYEVLGKMVVYLNQVIDNVNADTENVNTLKEAFEALEEYVNEAIQYDVHDLEEAVRNALHSAEMAAESATLASGSATSAQESAANAAGSAQTASESAVNALHAEGNAHDSAANAAGSALNAINASSQARGYAESANTSANTAANHELNAQNDALKSEGYALGMQNGIVVLPDSPYYHNNSKYYKENAETSATNANDAKDDAETASLFAEGISVGKQNGVDVDSSSPYYHNNAKYYAEQAGQSSGVSVSLVSLTDTDIQNPANGQVLAYDSADQKWKNSDEVQGVTSLEALTDTDITNPTADQILMYDAENEEWINGNEREVEISQTMPSYVGTKIWIDSSIQTPIEIPTSAEVRQILNTLTTNINRLDTKIDTKADASSVTAALSTKQNITSVVSEANPSAINLADNTEYYLTNVSDLAFTYPESGNYECWIYIETATSGVVSITFPASSYIGDAPTFGTSEKWEVSIKNGVIIAGKIE